MPVSKKRKKKNGKPVGPGADRLSGLTLQDLINVVAYQDTHPEEAAGVEDVELPEIQTVEDLDFEAPDTQAVIRAVHEARTYKVNDDNKEND